MAVDKINGFRAPYRSQTLQREKDAQIQANGLLTIDDDVSELGGNVIIPPFTAVQNGMLYSNDTEKSVIKPTTLPAPYYLTVTAPTSTNVDDLSFQFAKSPQDVSDTEVIIAEYDGAEWRQLPTISIKGMLSQYRTDLIDFRKVGPLEGLITSQVGPNYVVSKGTIVDKQGLKTRMDENIVIAAIDPDADWRRVDRMVYRRPEDDEKRIGTRKLVLGGAYSAGARTLYNTQIIGAVGVHESAQVLVSSDNSAHFFYAEGYGTSFTIKYSRYASNRTTQLVAPITVISASSKYFSVAIDSSDNIHLAYIVSGAVRWLKLDGTGATVDGPVIVDAPSTPCDYPQIAVDPLDMKAYFVYQSLLGLNNNQLFFATLNLDGDVVTAPLQITNTASDIVNPHMVVTDDLLVYIAYEDQTFGKVYFTVLDDIGSVMTASASISGATGSTSFGTLVDQAKKPKVQVADNKQVFVAFLQKKNLTAYGLAIYTNSNGTAYMPNVIASSEDFTSFDMVVDSFMNELHLVLSQASRVDTAKIDTLVPVFSDQISASGAMAVKMVKDKHGAMLSTWSGNTAGTYTNAGSAQTVQNIGPAAVAGSLNTLVLGSNEFSIPAPASHIPLVGERATIAGSANGNNGAKIVTAVTLASINAANDTYIVQVNSNYPSPEVPALAVTSQFATPDGNTVRFVKTAAELDEARALRIQELATDVLLARLSFPGPIILNYVPNGGTGFGVNSDLYGMYGNIDVDWSASSANSLTMTSGLSIVDLTNNQVYTVSGGTFPMQEEDALYVVLDNVNFNIAPQVTPISTLPWGTPIQVLGFIKGGEFNPHLFSVAGMGQMDVGEAIVLGQDLSKAIRIRLGITSENGYQAYSSTTQISPGDNYPTAISNLDAAVNGILTDIAKEESFTVGAGGQSIFTVTGFEFNDSNLIQDIQVYVNGIRKIQDTAGGTTEAFKKNSTTEIEFSYTIPENAVVTIRDERTGGGGGGGGGSTDLTNITVDPQPFTNGGFALGNGSKAWKSLYLKDTTSSQIYELKIIGGVIQVVPV